MTDNKAHAVHLAGVGMVSCLGRDWAHSAAAFRCGMDGIATLTTTTTYDDEDLETGLRGCPIAGYSDGFMQTGLWLRFALTCFDDLVTNRGLPGPEVTDFWQKVGVFWVLPDVVGERFRWPGDEIGALVDTWLNRIFQQHRPHPMVFGPSHVTCTDHAGTAAALQAAEAWLASGAVNHVLVFAVDSTLGYLDLEYFGSQGRLLSHSAKNGFLPGEAGTALLLTGNPTDALATVQGTATVVGDRPGDAAPDRPLKDFSAGFGQNIAAAVSKVLADVLPNTAFHGDLFVDLNGEMWRASAWGIATTQLTQWIDFDHCAVHSPADQIGEVGAAAPATALALATHAWQRGYAAGDRALIVTLDEDGTATATLIQAAPSPP